MIARGVAALGQVGLHALRSVTLVVRTLGPTPLRLCVCRGCRRRFVPGRGAAGQYCTRGCYENPQRPNRSRASRKKDLEQL